MLYKHQEDAIRFAINNNGCAALFHDPGLGKTRTTLEIFRHYRAIEPIKMLVICPLSLINAAWGEDTKKFTDFKYKAYSDIDNANELSKLDIVGINFESLIVEKRFKEIYSMLAGGNWMIAIDESSRLKAHKSITTKSVLKLSPLAKHRIILSGTPAPNGEWEFWAQAKFVNPNSLPDSFFQFRNTYFHLGRGNQVMPSNGRMMSRGMMAEIFSQGWKYMISQENRERMINQIKPLCHWVKKEDALDLPEKIDQMRMVRLNPNERRAYNDMRKHLVAELKTGRIVDGKAVTEAITAEVALAKLMKLRQLTSGFAYNENHVAMLPGKSSKLRELDNLLEELGDRQVIIWIQFHDEVDRIKELLGDKKYATLYSGTADKEASIKAFQNKEVQYLRAHPASAAHGLTFVNCSTCVYFSLDYSWEKYAQSRDRIHRIGQTNKCLYIHLIAEGTIDQMIMEVLGRKKTLQDVVFELMKEGR
jgi:SNF2 family DNA or RNA helicase